MFWYRACRQSGSQAESLILRTTQAEIGLGALALLAVSLFATGNLIELTGKIMEKIVLTMLLLASSGLLWQRHEIITVSRFEVGEGELGVQPGRGYVDLSTG